MTTTVRQNIFAAWRDGDVTDMEALRALCSDYEELDETYRQYDQMREQTRQQISEVVEHLGGRAEVRNFGKLTITAPTITEGYDKKLIRALIDDLIMDHPEIAQRLVACSTKAARAGGLRIEREKK